jgi:hypothetical protein
MTTMNARIRRAGAMPRALVARTTPGARVVARVALALALLLPVGSSTAAEPAAEPAPERAPVRHDDLLGEIIVEASEEEAKRIRLPPLVVVPSDATRPEVLALHAVVANDLDLAGMFEVDDSLDPRPANDTRPRVVVDVVVEAGQPPKMVARVERLRGGEWEAREVAVAGSGLRDRPAAHRLVDRLLGQLTGRDGAFAGRLAVVRRVDKGDPRLYVADPDGRNLKVASPPSQVVVAAAFDGRGALQYTASVDRGEIRLYREGELEPRNVVPRGSIYGLSFWKGRVALAIAQDSSIEVWTGTKIDALERYRAGSLDLHPVLGPGGRLAFAGEVAGGTRIFVNGRVVSQPYASSPTWCDHPEGPRLLWIVRSGRAKTSWVWSRRLGQPSQLMLTVRGKISATTCSPDGRLLLFSYDEGRALEGPGVYIGNVDVLRPQRILPHPARELAWGPAVEPAPSPTPAPSQAGAGATGR